MASVDYVASTPANPNILSFLDLPPEIRNCIYGFYFRHPDPLYITDTEDDLITLSRRVADSNHVLQMSGPRAPEKNRTTWRNRATYTTPSIARAYQPEIQLLRVCRKIHQEAASMLYSNNFCIAREFDIHPTHHDTIGYYMNSITTSWVHQIGQHKFFLRRLCIDLGSICVVGCRVRPLPQPQTFLPRDGYLQFGSLLQLVWESDRQITVTFMDPQPHLRCFIEFQLPQTIAHIHRYINETTQTGRNVERLNQTFQLLCNDGWCMKKFRRAIEDVGIKPDGSGGVFVFSTPINKNIPVSWCDEAPNPLLDDARYFGNDDDGTLRFIRPPPTRLLSLPSSVLTRIMKHTLYSQEGIKIDLDSFYNLKEVYGVLYSSKVLHDQYIQILLQNTFDLSMTTTEAHPNWDFTKLERILKTRFDYRGGIYNRATYLHFGTHVEYSISLHVDSSTLPLISSLAQVRINIMPLIVTTFTAAPERAVRIHLYTEYRPVKSHVITIEQLRKKALEALDRYVKRDHRTNFKVKCPEVWINGFGKIVNVVSTGSLKHPGWRDPEKTNRELWDCSKSTGYGGGDTDFDFIPDVKDPARFVYLHLKWIIFKDYYGPWGAIESSFVNIDSREEDGCYTQSQQKSGST